MKKIIIILIIIGLLATGLHVNKPEEKKSLKTIKVAEATLSSRKHQTIEKESSNSIVIFNNSFL